MRCDLFCEGFLPDFHTNTRDKVGAQSSQGPLRTIREQQGLLEHDSHLGWPELPLAGPQFIMACRGIQGDQGL